MRQCAVLLLAAACGCAVPVFERYRVEGSTQELLQAAHQTAHQLGWTTEDSQNGQFRITDYPRQPGTRALRVRAVDGELLIDGDATSRAPTEGALAFRLTEAAEILTRGTDARLHGLTGQPVAPRSKVVAVGLDLLLPAAGALYVLRGDPYYDSASVDTMRSYGWDLFLRAEGDALAVAFLIEGRVLGDRGGLFTSPWSFVLPIVIAVATRAFSIALDWKEVDFRNAYAASGLPSPDASYQPRVAYSSIDAQLP